jgi:hypothetical protein
MMKTMVGAKRCRWAMRWTAAMFAAFAMIGVVTPALAQESSLFEPSQHRQLLTVRIDQELRLQSVTEVLGVVDLVGGTAFAAYAAPHWNDDRPLVATTVIGFGLLDGLGVASLFVPRDVRTPMLDEVVQLAPVVVGLSIAVANEDYQFPRLTGAGYAAGFFAAGGISAINAFTARTRYSTLRADRARLDDPRDLTSAERSRMHHDLLGTRGLIPRRLIGACLIVAGAVSMSPAFSDRYSDQQRKWAAVLGGIQIVDGLLALPDSIVDGYENDLERLNISVAIAPGFIGLHGVFGG